MSSTSWLPLTLVFDPLLGWTASCPPNIASMVIDDDDYDADLEAFTQEVFQQISLLNDDLDHHMGRERLFEWRGIDIGIYFDADNGIYKLFEPVAVEAECEEEQGDDAE